MSLFSDMTDAFWIYLNADPDYVALGLKEYRRRDGNVLIADGGMPPPLSLFPAHACERIGISQKIIGMPATRRWTVTMQMRLTYAGSGPLAESSDVASADAMEAILTRLSSADATISSLGSSAVGGFDFGVDDIEPIVGDSGSGVLYWTYPYEVHLTRTQIKI